MLRLIRRGLLREKGGQAVVREQWSIVNLIAYLRIMLL